MSRYPDPSCVNVRATVMKVEETYVVAYPTADFGDLTARDSVTFSLPDWQGRNGPEYGQLVDLIDTALYVRGWRAKLARPVVPTQAFSI